MPTKIPSPFFRPMYAVMDHGSDVTDFHRHGTYKVNYARTDISFYKICPSPLPSWLTIPFRLHRLLRPWRPGGYCTSPITTSSRKQWTWGCGDFAGLGPPAYR
jgi:hypothetical protein